MTILAVENDEAVRTVTCSLLQTTDANVCLAISSEDVRKKALQQTPEVVLINYTLSDFDCCALIAWFKQWLPNSHIIITSAAPTDTIFDEVIEASADAFLPKPYQLAELCEYVAHALRIHATAGYVPDRAMPVAVHV